jgi:hypothetical protein
MDVSTLWRSRLAPDMKDDTTDTHIFCKVIMLLTSNKI